MWKMIIKIIFGLLVCMSFTNLSLAKGQANGLPKFSFEEVAIHYDDLDYSPSNDLIHPTVIKPLTISKIL